MMIIITVLDLFPFYHTVRLNRVHYCHFNSREHSFRTVTSYKITQWGLNCPMQHFRHNHESLTTNKPMGTFYRTHSSNWGWTSLFATSAYMLGLFIVEHSWTEITLTSPRSQNKQTATQSWVCLGSTSSPEWDAFSGDRWLKSNLNSSQFYLRSSLCPLTLALLTLPLSSWISSWRCSIAGDCLWWTKIR